MEKQRVRVNRKAFQAGTCVHKLTGNYKLTRKLKVLKLAST